MPDLNEVTRQDVEQEAADEFSGVDSHQLLLISIGRVSPTERQMAVSEADEPSVGNGNPTRLAPGNGSRGTRPTGVWRKQPDPDTEAVG
jgi:hypothetical protein